MLKKDELKQAIGILKKFTKSKPNQTIEDAIEMLGNEILYNQIKWDNTVNDISLIVSQYQSLANNYNCKLLYSVFSIVDTNYIDVYLNKNGYKCTVLEVSEHSKYNASAKLESILDSELVELASKIDKLID